MSSSNKLNLKTKLLIGFGIIILAILVLVIVSFSSLKKIDTFHDEMMEIEHTEVNLKDMSTDENLISSLSWEVMFEKNEIDRDSLINEIKAETVANTAYIIVIDSSLVNFPEQQLFFRGISANLKQLNIERIDFLKLVKQGKIDEAHIFMDSNILPLHKNILSDLLKLEKELEVISDEIYKDYLSLISRVDYLFFILGFGVILISLIIAYFMVQMLKKLSEEIRNGVTVLGTSAAEILSTVTEISSGAAETVTSVTETTTTVDEVRQTALVSNQKAQSLMLSSQKATDSVEKGRDSVNEVIVSMKKIDNQMTIISETVQKLSDQNHAIGEITSSVADIADQSNLLAVNAAIEASKAGEHGRGFTVVAQEIRSLADQSKKATAQVKEILNEINKSVNLTVGVTDQGSKTVEEGRKLVELSSEVIEILAENVDETAEAAIQISTSNQQQMAGMEQIVPAMENIKIASQQNVIGIKQAQTAANDLNNLGQNLKEIIKKFNL